ncbi:MAG: MinD/ParA family protein [Woeseiaceae bacterium]|nr:MinD/ParA family protein [Woeseiaceae bacterium]
MLEHTQAAGLRHFVAPAPVKVLAVCSGKGGVGKTNVAANLAIALGQAGRRVCLLDADVSLANVDVLLGLQPRSNLAHVLRGEADLENTMIDGPAGIRIIPASSGSFSMTDLAAAEQAGIIHAFGSLERVPDVLVVDTAAGITPAVARFVTAAQHALVVVCDEPASLTDAYALIKVFSQHYGIARFRIVTNQSESAGAGRALFDKLRRVTDAYLDVVLEHLGDVPRDNYLVSAVQQQRAVVDAYPRSPSGRAFRRLAERALALPDAAAAGGGIQFFFERLLAATHAAERADRGLVA